MKQWKTKIGFTNPEPLTDDEIQFIIDRCEDTNYFLRTVEDDDCYAVFFNHVVTAETITEVLTAALKPINDCPATRNANVLTASISGWSDDMDIVDDDYAITGDTCYHDHG